jgi:hypothetical protein
MEEEIKGLCPKCGKEIYSLKCYSHEEVYRRFEIDEDGFPEYNDEEYIQDDDKDEFECNKDFERRIKCLA